MTAALTRQYREYRNRTLITGMTSALVLAAVVFVVHDLHDELLKTTFGFSDRLTPRTTQ